MVFDWSFLRNTDELDDEVKEARQLFDKSHCPPFEMKIITKECKCKWCGAIESKRCICAWYNHELPTL